jgi:hypothetical protein
MDMTPLIGTFRDYANAPSTYKKMRFGTHIVRWDNNTEINVAGDNVDCRLGGVAVVNIIVYFPFPEC